MNRGALCAALSVWMMAFASVQAQTKQVTYYYTDPQGTVLATADENGNVIEKFDYRPYGAAVLGHSAGDVGYAGALSDPEAGLIYMGARFFDPDVGRFISIDPVSPGPGRLFAMSNYAYADNNPVNRRDPSGLYTCQDDGDGKCVMRVDEAVARLRQAEKQLSGDKRTSVRRILSALGPKGGKGAHGEQVNFRFGSLDSHTYGLLSQTGEKSFTITLDTNNQDADFGSAGYQYSPLVEQAATIAHEGQHVVDAMDGKFRGRDWNSVLFGELSAFRSQAYFNEGMRMRSHFLLFNPDLPPGDQARASREAIYNAALDDARATCASRACPGAP